MGDIREPNPIGNFGHNRGEESEEEWGIEYSDDDAWIEGAEEKVELAKPTDHPEELYTIFQVPIYIRQLGFEPYVPQIVCLGPFFLGLFHRTDSYITKYHKWRCVRHLLFRHRSREHNQLLKGCLLQLRKLDEKVRSCYSREFFALNAQNMALIMLLDGCFIIYLMLKMCPRQESRRRQRRRRGLQRREGMIETREGEVVLHIEEDEQLEGPTVAGQFTINVVIYDLLKLENQIPFFIIQLLFDLLKPCNDGLVDLALGLFKDIHPEESESFKKSKKKSPEEYHHLLHLFYSSRIPSEELEEPAPEGEAGEVAPSQGASTSAPTSTSAQGEVAPSQGASTSTRTSTSAQGEVAPSQGASTSTPTSTSAQEEVAPSQGASTSTPTSTSTQGEVAPSQGASTSAQREATPKWIPSATELLRAGVKFKKKDHADSFLNIQFHRRKMKLTPWLCLRNLYLMFRSGRMEIPPLQIYDYTGPLFQNLIAFEQCYFDTEMYFTIYALFMDCIIDQAEDVRLLQLKGILEHKLSSPQAVADLFNKLGSHLHYIQEKNYLANQIKEVNRFYNFKWHKWLAALRREYLGNPWATISVLAAVFLLLLTVEQAVFSALSYFHSP